MDVTMSFEDFERTLPVPYVALDDADIYRAGYAAGLKAAIELCSQQARTLPYARFALLACAARIEALPLPDAQRQE